MENKKFVLTISEFAKRARTTVRTLRFYEEMELMKPERQNNSGHKLYGFEELARLQQIQALKFLGYSLQEIKSLVENDSDATKQLERSLPWQYKLLKEKRDELNRAIEAIERVHFLLAEGKPITWTILSSLLFQMENEQDQLEWVKEHFSEEITEQFSALPIEQRHQMDMEMLDWLETLKKLMSDGVSPESPQAINLAVRLSDIATKHIENKEELAKQMEKALESVETETVDFKFPTILSPEEEAFLEEIGKSIKAQYQSGQYGND
ncbi:Mercuric resistance operon regulatory protein [Lentibacillus sp. JNUCC-1]|uniref:MerR family transcriptional regulator n=1 Tax=Lentibacillus sp. JNUCC-1 TaxID=2654513 RepID=UPI0012E8CA11|nr:MerR family transcriptional regulator [Lentibacillus sp. JNUCC-1]MUV37834.1 Mercuric resistance operon regulatory protein [Lentibacillus sp. JNUCC-1]